MLHPTLFCIYPKRPFECCESPDTRWEHSMYAQFQIHTWKSAHMDRRDRDQMGSGTAEAIMFWREAAQGLRTGCRLTGPFRPMLFKGVCMDLTGTYWTDLDDWDLNLLNSPGAVHSVPSCNTEAGWSVEVCGNRKQEEKWLLRNTFNDLVRPVNICNGCVLQLRLSADIWSLELGGSSMILLVYYWSRPANRDI